jgi:WAS/WASL-interacting protein
LIAAAVVFFILFVSTQALRDWPISSLNFGGGGESASISPAQSLGGSSANPAAANLNGPITAAPANVGAAAKAGGGGNNNNRAGRHDTTGNVAPETQIQSGRGIDSAPVQQPSSTSPAPAPTSGSAPPAGSGTASPSPGGGSGSSPATGNSGGSGNQTSGGNVGTRTARRVTNTVNEISNAAAPPSPSPVTNTVGEVAEKVAPTPPPAGTTVEKVKGAVEGIGN